MIEREKERERERAREREEGKCFYHGSKMLIADRVVIRPTGCEDRERDDMSLWGVVSLICVIIVTVNHIF